MAPDKAQQIAPPDARARSRRRKPIFPPAISVGRTTAAIPLPPAGATGRPRRLRPPGREPLIWEWVLPRAQQKRFRPVVFVCGHPATKEASYGA